MPQVKFTEMTEITVLNELTESTREKPGEKGTLHVGWTNGFRKKPPC